MAVKPWSKEKRAELHAALRERWQENEPEPPDIVNLSALAELEVPREMEFRGVAYRVPPISFKAGWELTSIRNELRRFARLEKELDESGRIPSDMERRDYLRLCERAADLFREIVVPARWWRRLIWRRSANPFASASDSEIGRLLGFFWRCRMVAAAQHLAAQNGGDPRPST